MSEFNSLDGFNDVNYMYANMGNPNVANKENSNDELNDIISSNNANSGSMFKLRAVTETESVEEYDEMKAYAEMKRMENNAYSAKAEVIVEQYAEEARVEREKEEMARRIRRGRGLFGGLF